MTSENEYQIRAIAQETLAELEAFEWLAYSDREGDAIVCGCNALRKIAALLGGPNEMDSTYI